MKPQYFLHAAKSELRNVYVALLLLIFYLFAPAVEGAVNPVFVNVNLTDIEEKIDASGNPYVILYGHAYKNRNCTYDHTDAFLLNKDGEVKLPLTILEAPKIRPIGDFDWGPWTLPVTKQEFLTRVYMTSYHNCHIVWQTKTSFYP